MESTKTGFMYAGIWQPTIIKNNKVYRERVEALVLNDNNQIFLSMKGNDYYRIPGGGTEPNKTTEEQLHAECHEEAKILISDEKYMFTYDELYEKELKLGDNIYHGDVTLVYIAKYSGSYIGYISPIDLDYNMYSKGKFYDIKKVWSILKPEHQKALKMYLGDDIEHEMDFHNVIELALNTKMRNDLDDKEFGLPSERKYPLNDKNHVLQAIRFFKHCPVEKRKELGKNINKKLEKFNMSVKIGENNPAYNYISNKYIIKESMVLTENVNIENKIEFDNNMRRILDVIQNTSTYNSYTTFDILTMHETMINEFIRNNNSIKVYNNGMFYEFMKSVNISMNHLYYSCIDNLKYSFEYFLIFDIYYQLIKKIKNNKNYNNELNILLTFVSCKYFENLVYRLLLEIVYLENVVNGFSKKINIETGIYSYDEVYSVTQKALSYITSDVYITDSLNWLKSNVDRDARTLKDDINITMESIFSGIKFKKDGSVSIILNPNKSFMDQYDEIHKVLQEDNKNHNIEGMKHNLALMFSLITMIERNKKYKNRDSEAVKARAFAINDFKSYLKIIQKEDKNFDFMRFYEENHYGKTILNITPETIQGLKQIFKSIIL